MSKFASTGGAGELPLHYAPRRRLFSRASRAALLGLCTLALIVQVVDNGLVSLPRWRNLSSDATRRRTPSNTQNPAYIVEATKGAVASENEVCSTIGVDAMKAGGNAVDAIIATTLCIGVVNMFSSVHSSFGRPLRL